MRQRLVIFSGLPGVGKSTLAEKLARKLRWPLLKIDDVIGQVPENPGIEFWDSKVDVLLNLVNTQLELGLDVIVDSVFNRDYAVVQGVVLVTATAYIMLNLLADMTYFLVNPRLRG